MNGLPKLHSDIAPLLADYEAARSALIAAIPLAQASCEHPVVLHADYERLDYFGSLQPLRMCAACRLEEEGTHWSTIARWNPDGYGEALLDNREDRLVVTLGRRDEIYRLRLPGERYISNKLCREEEVA